MEKLQDNIVSELNRDCAPRERADINEQQWDIINNALLHSMQQRSVISIHLFDPMEQLLVTGIVDLIDRSIGRFKVDGEWFIVGDIEYVETDVYL